jgi:hypothetical protein
MANYRERYVRQHIGDLITDALEEALLKKTLTQEEVRQAYADLAEILDDDGFRPKKPRLVDILRECFKPVWNPRSGIQP